MAIDIEVFMPLITEASQAKTLAYQALGLAKEQDIKGYEAGIADAKSI